MANIETRWLKDNDTEEIFYPIAHEKAVVCGENNDKTLDEVLEEKAEVSEVNKVKETLTDLESAVAVEVDCEIEWLDNHYISNNTGAVTDYNGWKCSNNFIPLRKSKRIHTISNMPNQRNYNAFYDENQRYIKSFEYMEDGYVDVPENAAYFKVSLDMGRFFYAKTVEIAEGSLKSTNQNITDMLMLGWKVPAECPVQNSVSGNVFTQRVGRVDLGSFEWTRHNDGRFMASFSGYKTVPTVKDVANIYCILYKADSHEHSADSTFDNIIALGATGNNFIFIRDSSYTDATAFKNAMQGVYMYYELATPVTKVVDGNENSLYQHSYTTENEEFIGYYFGEKLYRKRFKRQEIYNGVGKRLTTIQNVKEIIDISGTYIYPRSDSFVQTFPLNYWIASNFYLTVLYQYDGGIYYDNVNPTNAGGEITLTVIYTKN